jgi:hypothetical protein
MKNTVLLGLLFFRLASLLFLELAQIDDIAHESLLFD